MSTSLEKPPGYQERVKLVLGSLGKMKGAALADACSVSEGTISKWRNGGAVPSDPATLARLARVDLGLLVYGPTDRLRMALDAVSEGA